MLVAAFAAVAVNLLLALGPPLAQAAALDVIRDCAEDEVLDRRHSRAEKKAALRALPGDVAEYTDCRSIIAASIGGGGRGKAQAPAGPGAADRVDGAGAGGARAAGGVRASGRAANAAARRRDRAEAVDSDEAVAGSLLSGAEAIGKAPLDVVGAAAGGRLGVPGYVWGLLVAAALIGLGVLREYRASSAG